MGNSIIDIKSGLSCISTNVIFLIDRSYSMSGEKIKAVNTCMPEILEKLVEVANSSEMDVFVRVISYDSNVSWTMGTADQGVNVEEAAKKWKNLVADASTNTAGAIEECCKALNTKNMGTRNKKPVVILITDGESDDFSKMKKATDKLKKALSGETNKEKVIRVAIGIEQSSQRELEYFATKGRIKNGEEIEENQPYVFHVTDANEIAKVIKNVTVSSLYTAINSGAIDNKTAGLVMDETPILDMTENTPENWD